MIRTLPDDVLCTIGIMLCQTHSTAEARALIRDDAVWRRMCLEEYTPMFWERAVRLSSAEPRPTWAQEYARMKRFERALSLGHESWDIEDFTRYWESFRAYQTRQRQGNSAMLLR